MESRRKLRVTESMAREHTTKFLAAGVSRQIFRGIATLTAAFTART